MAPAPRTVSPRAPKFRPRSTSDRALAAAGFALAFCSVTFAGYMMSDRDYRPFFPGLEYLAIFSQPSHRIQAPAHPAPQLARLDVRDDPNGVDPTPTGSISTPARAEPPDAAGLPPPRYRVVSATREAAWVESELGFRQVKPGDVLSGFGRIAAIERRNARWALIAESGSILELSDASFLPPAEGDPDRRFARRMIFGRQPQ
jgi:hypothetical protein